MTSNSMRMNNRVLIVDDEPVLLGVIAQHFRRMGYEVDTTTDVEAAEDLLSHVDYSLVITDLALTTVGFRGFELIAQTWDLFRRPKVIVMTGQARPELAVEAMRQGVDAFLHKPVHLVDLSDMAARLLGAIA